MAAIADRGNGNGWDVTWEKAKTAAKWGFYLGCIVSVFMPLDSPVSFPHNSSNWEQFGICVLNMGIVQAIGTVGGGLLGGVAHRIACLVDSKTKVNDGAEIVDEEL